MSLTFRKSVHCLPVSYPIQLLKYLEEYPLHRVQIHRIKRRGEHKRIFHLSYLTSHRDVCQALEFNITSNVILSHTPN